MKEDRGIYEQPDRGNRSDNLPAYERTPAQIRAEMRRKAVLFGAVLFALAVIALLLAVSQAEKASEKRGLRDLLTKPSEPPARTAPSARAAPSASVAPDLLRDGAIPREPEARGVAPSVSPEDMAAAMSELRTAKQYLESRNWDQAETHVTNALARCPDMALALRLRGIIFTQRGQFDEAIETLEKAIRHDPYNAEAFNTLAQAHLQRKEYDRAEELMLTSLSLRPGFAPTELNLGLLYILTARYEMAIGHLETAAKGMPSNSAIANNIGVCLLRLNRLDDARAKLLELVGRDPRHVGSYFNIAMTFALQNDAASAVAWLRQGAAHCSQSDVQRFLSDRDFDPIRQRPEYQDFIREMYPQLPKGPGG